MRRRIVLTDEYHVDLAKQRIDQAYQSGKLWQIHLSRANKRSDNQNRRYWALLRDISLCTGQSTDELHDLMKHKFLGSHLFTSTQEDPELFNAYILSIEGWAIGWLGMDLDKTLEIGG